MKQYKFTNYVKEHGHYMKSLALHMSMSQEDAQDLEQDTWLKIFEYSNRYVETNKFRSWASVIMRNIFRNNFRQKLRRGQCVEINDSHLLISEIEDSSLSYSDLYRSIGMLSKDMSSVLFMYLDGFSYEEIAGALHIPLGTVKSRISSSKKKLHLVMKPY